MKAITRRLRVLRAERDISQRDLSIKAGLQYWLYMDIEKGYREATAEERSRIARALKVQPDDVWQSEQSAVAS